MLRILPLSSVLYDGKTNEEKECLQKQCRHLVKNPEHAYWKLRESMKQKRKARKERINLYLEAISA